MQVGYVSLEQPVPYKLHCIIIIIIICIIIIFLSLLI
jgi:hypothetical protein